MSYITTVLGTLLFTVIFLASLRISRGQWNFKKRQRAQYEEWVNKNGLKFRNWIFFLAVIYYLGMLAQLLII